MPRLVSFFQRVIYRHNELLESEPRKGKNVKAKIESMWKTYEAINELIRFADTKATAILAVNGVIAGFFFSNIGALQTILQQKPAALAPLLMVSGFLLISSGFCAYCIIPRLKMSKSKCLILFCDIADFPSAEDYQKGIGNEMDDEKIEKHLADQIWVNSKIATRKYDAVTVAIILFVALLFASIAFMLTTYWS